MTPDTFLKESPGVFSSKSMASVKKIEIKSNQYVILL